MEPVATLTRPTVRKRSLRGLLIRLLIALVLLAVAAYATLPLWLPVGWIGRIIAAGLAEQLGRPVHVGSIRVSWRDGVVLENLTIPEPSGAAQPLLARIGQIRCGFTPLRTLITGRVDRLEIVEPQLWLATDAEGRFLLPNLDVKPGKLLTLDYELRDAASHVHSPGVEQTFRLDHARCRLDPDSGLLHLVADAGLPRDAGAPAESEQGRIQFDARITVPQLNRKVSLGGDVTLEWSRLALTDLPLPLVARIPIEQIAGTTTGHLTLKTHPDLGIDLEDLEIALKGVTIHRQDLGRTSRLPDALLRCDGHWDPATDVLSVRTFSYESPAVRLRASGDRTDPALLLDPLGPEPFHLRMEGDIRDVHGLRREVPEIADVLDRLGLRLDGGAAFTLAFVRSLREDALELRVDGESLACAAALADADLFTISKGVPKTLHLEADLNHDPRRPSRLRVSSTLGDLAFSADATLPLLDTPDALPLDALAEAWPEISAELTLRTRALDRAITMFPALAGRLDVTGWTGSADVGISLRPNDDASRLKVSAELAPAAALTLADWLHKPAGHALAFNAQARLPHRPAGRIDDIDLDLRYGPARLAAGGPTAMVDCRWPPINAPTRDRDTATDIDAVIPFRSERVEQLLGLCPRWGEWQRAHPTRTVAGSLEGQLVLSLHHGDADARSARLEFAAVADQLALGWEQLFDKPAGVPLQARVEVESRVDAATHHYQARLQLRRPDGELSADVHVTGATAHPASVTIRDARLAAELADASPWIAMSPKLASTIRDTDLTGALRLDARYEHDADRNDAALHFSADATDAGFVLLGERSVTKASGVPAFIQLTGRVAPADNDRQRCTLDEGRLQLAGFRADHLTGDALLSISRTETDLGAATEIRAATVKERSTEGVVDPTPWEVASRLISLNSASIEARGRIDFDDSLKNLHPALAEWCRAAALAGHADWQARVDAGADTLALTANVDLAGAAVELETNNAIVPVVHKPAATPASLAIDVEATPSNDTGAVRLDIRDLTLSILENTVHTTGRLAIAAKGDSLAFGDAMLTSTFTLDQPERLLSLLPDSRIDAISGRCEGDLAITATPTEFHLAASRLAFDDFHAQLRSDPMRLDGELLFDQHNVDVERLDFAWGEAAGSITGRLHAGDAGYESRLAVAIDRLDVEELADQIDALLVGLGLTTRDDTESSDPVRPVLALLAQTDAALDVRIGGLGLTVFDDLHVLAEALAIRLNARPGPLEAGFHLVLDGGDVLGRIETRADVDEPILHITYTADALQPGPVVDGYLARMFPGLRATGPLTLIDESFQALPAPPAEIPFPVGQGELIIDGGTVAGRAAPLWMTRVFPGLNLARFDFSYMHSWFEKFPSGRTTHRMIFQGQYYNIYMDGYSDADQTFRYEVGVDFLANFDSKYWSEVGQGRIPLFTKTGRVAEDGALLDETVQYVPEHLVWALLIRNNPVVTAYHAVRKRVLQNP